MAKSIIRNILCSPIVCLILTWTSSLVTFSMYEICSILWLVTCHINNLYSSLELCWKLDVIKEWINRILVLREILSSIQAGFSLVLIQTNTVRGSVQLTQYSGHSGNITTIAHHLMNRPDGMAKWVQYPFPILGDRGIQILWVQTLVESNQWF